MKNFRAIAEADIVNSILKLIKSKDILNFRNISYSHIKYMLIFPLAPIFANMQGEIFSDEANIFGLDAMTLMGSAYCVGAGVLFALTQISTIAKFSNIISVMTALSFISWSLLNESLLGLVIAVMFAACLGGCAACASFSYTFVLNNTERFIGAALISLFFALNQINYGFSIISELYPKTYLTLLVIGSCICLLLYEKKDFVQIDDKPDENMNPTIGLMLYFFIAHYFVEIFYTYLPGAALKEAFIYNGAVGILVIILAIILQFVIKRSVWHMCNIFFIAMILTYALYFTPENLAFRKLAYFMHGFEQMGYIVAYYLLGCIFKKCGNFRLFKICLVTILPASIVAYIIPGMISSYVPDLLPLAATVISSLIFIFFILLSPAYSKYLFFTDWIDNFYEVDMAKDSGSRNISDISEGLGLSVRESEVLKLLLLGNRSKQIAENLEISVHTVNFHIKNIYKKLDVSNRAELFAKFNSSSLTDKL